MAGRRFSVVADIIGINYSCSGERIDGDNQKAVHRVHIILEIRWRVLAPPPSIVHYWPLSCGIFDSQSTAAVIPSGRLKEPLVMKG